MALAWGLARASGSGWTDGLVVGSLLGSLVLLAGFVLRERYAVAPMLPLRLFRIRAFAAANTTGFLMSGAIFSAAFLTSQYFQLGLGYGPLATGLRLLPWTATMMPVAAVFSAHGQLGSPAGVVAGFRPALAVSALLSLAGALAALTAGAGSARRRTRSRRRTRLAPER